VHHAWTPTRKCSPNENSGEPSTFDTLSRVHDSAIFRTAQYSQLFLMTLVGCVTTKNQAPHLKAALPLTGSGFRSSVRPWLTRRQSVDSAHSLPPQKASLHLRIFTSVSRTDPMRAHGSQSARRTTQIDQSSQFLKMPTQTRSTLFRTWSTRGRGQFSLGSHVGPDRPD
jgi:hypothetical protein